MPMLTPTTRALLADGRADGVVGPEMLSLSGPASAPATLTQEPGARAGRREIGGQKFGADRFVTYRLAYPWVRPWLSAFGCVGNVP